MAILFNSRKKPGMVVIQNTNRQHEFAMILPVHKLTTLEEPDKGSTHVLLRSDPTGLVSNGIVSLTYHPDYQSAKSAYVATISANELPLILKK